MNLNKLQCAALLKTRAIEMGFLGLGIATAERLDSEAKQLEAWLNKGHQASMHYMENHFDKRVDPRLLVPGAKSVVSLAYNYFPKQSMDTENNYQLARYAYGKDYHHVLKAKLRELVEWMHTEFGQFDFRIFVDSGPVMERQWAAKAGLGWIGKNGLLLSKQVGSYFFLAEIICDLDLQSDAPVADHCGNCTACIDACPTDAISEKGYELDANKCISYLTIERKEAIPESFQGKMQEWIFGCDICQEVCPWNRFAQAHNEPQFDPPAQLMHMRKSDWEDLSEATYRELFRGSAVKRTKYSGLKRNIAFAAEQDDLL